MNWSFSLRSVPILLGLILFLGGFASGQSQIEKVTEVEGITEYKLENGVPVLLFPDVSKPQFTVNMTVLVGSRHEGYGETGMAHLLEHMLFKGTPTHDDIPALLKERGVLNLNGTTWYDRTNYYETLPTSDENLEFAIKMEADRLLNSTIKGEDLASEMTVVRNEFERGENSPQRVLFQRAMAVAYEWHNYGKSTIGNRTDIERVPVKNLRDFYTKFYQPDNITVVVAGKFDEKKALEYLNKYFGQLEMPKRELPKTYTEEPAQDGERIVYLRRSGDTQVVGAAYHIVSAASEDFAACQVLSRILGMEPSGPLYKALVATKIASSVSNMEIAAHDPGMILAMAEVPNDGDIDKAREVLIREVEKIGTEGVSSDLVLRAVQQILKGREAEFANSERFAISLSEWQAYGDWRLYFLHRDRLERVSAEDVKRVASQFCVASNRTVGMFIPTDKPVRAPIASRPNLKKMLDGYKGREKIAAGEAFDPNPDTIQQRTTFGELDSGIKYAFLPKKTRDERVSLQAQLKYGDMESLKGKTFAVRYLGSMLGRGTKSLGFQEYKDKLDELKATVRFGGSTGSLTVSIQTKKEFFNEVLGVVRQALREPAFDAEEFEIVKNETVTRMESMQSEPQALAGVEFQRKTAPYSKDDVRYTHGLEEGIAELKKVTIDDVRGLYDEFLSGKHGELAVVGDFDPEAALPELNKIFADWTSNVDYKRIPQPAIMGLAGETVKIETPDKKNAVYIAGVSAPLKDDNPDYEALLVGNYILGGGPLASRLADRVRKKEGLSYTVASQFQADSKDENGMFLMFAISNPENTPKVISTIDEEVTRMLESGVTEEELGKAKESYLKTRQGRRAQDSALAGLLMSNLSNDRTMEFQKVSDARIENLSKADVDEALRRHFKKDNLIIITAGDFAAAEAKAAEKAESSDAEDANENK